MTDENKMNNPVKVLAELSGILDGTGTLYIVCEQAIREGEGTPERVREIWDEATAEQAAGREVAP